MIFVGMISFIPRVPERSYTEDQILRQKYTFIVRFVDIVTQFLTIPFVSSQFREGSAFKSHPVLSLSPLLQHGHCLALTFVTTLHAPTTHPFPIVTPLIAVTLAANQRFLPN